MADKALAHDEGVREAPGLVLHRVLELKAQARTVAQELLKSPDVPRRGDHQNLPNPREHQRRQGIVDHGLVVDRQHLLGQG